MLNKNVVVIDSDTIGKRRGSIFREFASLPDVKIFSFDDKNDEITERMSDGRWRVRKDKDIEFLLCMIHAGDAKAMNKVRARYRVWLSGEEGIDKRCSPKEDKIWRAISAPVSLIPEEAQEIFEYVISGCIGEKPSCFFPPRPKFLPALSILCQGYLATNSKSPDPLVQKALNEMGWSTFKNPSIQTDLSGKKSETKKRSWWLDPFDIDCRKSNKEIHRQIDKIHDQIVKEWNVPKHGEVCSCIKELTDALKKTILIEDEAPPIVANAYLAISHRLAKE